VSANAGAPAASAQRLGLDFAGIFAVTFCGLLAVGAVLPVLPRYVHGPLDSGDVAVGIVIGSYAVTGLLLRPLAGRLADRRGRKLTVLLGALLLGLSGLIYLPSLGLAGLIVARLVLGAGEGSLYTAGSAWIIDMAPPARRGRVLGLYGLAVWGGLSLGPLVGELLLNAGGYTAVWLFAAAIPIVGALFAVRVTDPFVPLGHAEPHPLIAPEAVRPGMAIALASVGYAAVAAFVVLHLEQRGVGHGATVFAAFAAMIVLSRLILGGLPDRVGPARIAIGATLVEAAGLVTIALAHSLPVAILGGCAMGVGFSLLNPSLMLIAVGRVAESARGATMGTYTAFFDAGVGIGAPIAGLAAALTGYEGAFLLAAAIAVGSSVLSLTMLRGTPARELASP
jgi:MFS family permease